MEKWKRRRNEKSRDNIKEIQPHTRRSSRSEKFTAETFSRSKYKM